jgi:hypothetical protein
MACKPNDNHGGSGDRQGRGEMRRLCHDDMEKLCPNLKGHDRRQCLQQNQDKLSEGCKTALKERMERRRKRKNQQ